MQEVQQNLETISWNPVDLAQSQKRMSLQGYVYYINILLNHKEEESLFCQIYHITSCQKELLSTLCLLVVFFFFFPVVIFFYNTCKYKNRGVKNISKSPTNMGKKVDHLIEKYENSDRKKILKVLMPVQVQNSYLSFL